MRCRYWFGWSCWQQMSCALPVIAAKTALLFAVVAFRAGTVLVRARERFLAGMDFCGVVASENTEERRRRDSSL